ncbi:MAG TPA: PIN domain-containing protein, partial [Ilumatobacter sp.]|nr:PIN domain-containing protein [Ilumatobacter sp.]
MLYVDTSALLKRYVDEHDSALVQEILLSDPVLVTSQLTEVEVRRNLARLLDGDALLSARRDFAIDLDSFALVVLDRTV